MKTLGSKLRYFRLLKELSQEDMANELDISLPAYSKIERNITDVNFSRLSQIAKVLNISVADLLSVNKSNELETENNKLRKLILEKDKEIISLQKRIIELLSLKTK